MAKTIELLLTADVLKLGNMGDVVKVKPGYARNFLLPYGKAIVASGAAKRQIEVLREKAAAASAEREGQALAEKKKIDGLTIEIKAKVSHDTHLFGSVGTRDIVAALADKGYTFDSKQVHVHESFKKLGSYEVVLKLFKTVEATIKVNVIDADPEGQKLQEVLAAADGDDADAQAEG